MCVCVCVCVRVRYCVRVCLCARLCPVHASCGRARSAFLRVRRSLPDVSLALVGTGVSDSVAAVRVRAPTLVVLHGGCEYAGGGGARALPMGHWQLSPPWHVRSISVPPGYAVQLFEDAQFEVPVGAATGAATVVTDTCLTPNR